MPTETLTFSSSPTAEWIAALNRTYHDMIEAAYFGRVRKYHGYGVSVAIAPMRNDPSRLNRFVTMPSYHFGSLLGGVVEQMADVIKLAPAETIAKHMDALGRDRLAIVFDIVEGEQTCIVEFDRESGSLTTYLALYDVEGGISGRAGSWVAFPRKYVETVGARLIWVGSVGLELLANPKVEHVMTLSPTGVAKMSQSRVKRGECGVQAMTVIHLTKKVYVGGRAIYPRAEATGGERSPHDRSGHYRHSKRHIAGWEGPLTETSGEWVGVTCYRRWIDDVKVKGGAAKSAPDRGHPKAAQPKATQFRVVQ